MTRRFPAPLPGLPTSKQRYRLVLETLADSEGVPTVGDFVSELRPVLNEAADGDGLSRSWTRHIVTDLIRSGFINNDGPKGDDQLTLGVDSQRWLAGELDFETFVFNAIKRGWVLKATHPEGIEALERTLHALVYECDLPATSRAVKSTLGEEYDYEFSRQGIRGYLPLLEQLGHITETEDGYDIPEAVDAESRLQQIRRADIFRQLENWLRREGAMVNPPPKTAKRALMKYYMYRESGGWSKRKQWYRQFHRNYLNTSAQEGTHKSPDLLRKPSYNKAENRRDRLKDEIVETFGLDPESLSNYSISDLQRIANADSRSEADRIRVQSGSSVSRATLAELVSEDRSYAFGDDFELYDWQAEAAQTWFEGTEQSAPLEGIAEVVTGAGKTVMALEIIRRWLEQTDDDDGVVTIVVPTRVLMYQWLTELTSKLNVPVDEIGWSGDGHRSRFSDGVRVMVSIVNTAVKDDFLAGALNEVGKPPHLLIADECHNYTGDVHSNVLQYHSTATLGLSATPTDQPQTERNEEPSDDDQLLFNHLGPVYYSLTYGEAIEQELIPRFEINYVGFDLSPREQQEYEQLTREISDALSEIRMRYSNRLYELGGPLYQKLNVIRESEENPHPAIGSFFTLTQERRDLIENAVSRQAITLELLRDIEADEKAIVFQEKIEQLEQLIAPQEQLGITREGRVVEGTGLRSEKYDQYPELERVDQQIEELFADPNYWPVMYHSGHRSDIWNQFAMEWFRSDDHANVMYSVKALIEGVDVPDADTGIIRVSSGSVRQRIQTLGRILRTGDDPDSVSELYVFYARDTVDENIFRNYDWDEQLGTADITHKRWVTDGSPLDGEIVDADDELPTPETKTLDYPDPDELQKGDEYTGPTQGYTISVDTNGRPFEKGQKGKRYITNDDIETAADIVYDWKGGGTIHINDRGHMVTIIEDGDEHTAIFLGVTDGPDSFTYEEPAGLTDEAPSGDDLFG